MSQKPTYDELLNRLNQLESELLSNISFNADAEDDMALYRVLFDHILYEVHVWELVRDKTGTIKTWKLVNANPIALQNWGKSLQDVRGLIAEEVFPDAKPTEKFMPIVEKIFSENKPFVWESYFAGTKQTLQMVSIPVGECFVSCGIDVSDIKRIESEIRESQQRLKLATEAAKIGVWEYNIETGRIVWDQSMYRIYGVDPSETLLPFTIWEDSVHKDDIARARWELDKAIASISAFNSEFRIVTRDTGEVKHIQANATTQSDADGKPNKMVGVNFDITERKKYEREIETLAFYDTLTGLPNRSMIDDRLSQSIELCGQTGKFGALLFIDLDNFKHVNDTAGHAVGDELLAALAKRMKTLVQPGDTVGRFGGDEFIIILNNLNPFKSQTARAAKAFALKVVELIQEPIEISSGLYNSTASIGITLFTQDVAVNDVLRQADLAMYKAKGSGRNQMHFFDPAMQQQIVERVQLEKELVESINKEHFEVHYQIQMGETGAVKGAEALLRWNHPEKGLISPAVFIPIAEESGHIKRLGRWIFKTVCDDLNQVIGDLVDDSFILSVNVSALQVCDEDFSETVKVDLLQSGINAAQIKLELTESALFSEAEQTLRAMQELHEVGIKFSLDDFGTGYSSLTRLKELPIDELKIDQSFVRDIETNPDSAAIAKSIIALANSLDIGVIAEGVETPEQIATLQRMGCHAFQGFYFSRPLPLAEFTKFIQYRL